MLRLSLSMRHEPSASHMRTQSVVLYSCALPAKVTVPAPDADGTVSVASPPALSLSLPPRFHAADEGLKLYLSVCSFAPSRESAANFRVRRNAYPPRIRYPSASRFSQTSGFRISSNTCELVANPRSAANFREPVANFHNICSRY